MSVKLDRLGHIFTEAISKIINEEVKDDDIKFVTITAVDITNDLSYAKVEQVPLFVVNYLMK